MAYHSDGMIWAVIPDLIEIGLDVLNPVQPACMEPDELKRRFGDRLCFWGSIDEQHTLPFGSPEDVRAEVRTRLRTIGRHGGLILGPTHHVQLDTPMEQLLGDGRDNPGADVSRRVRQACPVSSVEHTAGALPGRRDDWGAGRPGGPDVLEIIVGSAASCSERRRERVRWQVARSLRS